MMTLCPIALGWGCEACPVFKICPAKTLIGNYNPENSPQKDADTESSNKAD